MPKYEGVVILTTVKSAGRSWGRGPSAGGIHRLGFGSPVGRSLSPPPKMATLCGHFGSRLNLENFVLLSSLHTGLWHPNRLLPVHSVSRPLPSDWVSPRPKARAPVSVPQVLTVAVQLDPTGQYLSNGPLSGVASDIMLCGEWHSSLCQLPGFRRAPSIGHRGVCACPLHQKDPSADPVPPPSAAPSAVPPCAPSTFSEILKVSGEFECGSDKWWAECVGCEL